jgi:hypothetical protein
MEKKIKPRFVQLSREFRPKPPLVPQSASQAALTVLDGVDNDYNSCWLRILLIPLYLFEVISLIVTNAF